MTMQTLFTQSLPLATYRLGGAVGQKGKMEIQAEIFPFWTMVSQC